MSTNEFPGIGKNTKGKDFNYYKKITVTSTDFGSDSVSGEQPDVVFGFTVQSLMLLNEGAGGSGNNVIEYSFNGNTVHGELDPDLPSRALSFDNRSVSMIWFRIKSGSTSSVIRVDAWGLR